MHLSIVEDRRPHFAGIMKAGVKRLRVTAGTFHADSGRDVALGESGLDRGRCSCGADSGRRHECEDKSE